jgi:hypothetical protein
MFVWFLPAILLGLLLLVIFLGGLLWHGIFPGLGNPLTILAGIIIFLAGMIALIVAALYVTMGAVRFARTGGMVEGWRYSTITAIIRRIGWGRYFIALVLLAVVSVLFNILVSLPAIIPYIGWIVPVILSPLLTVFSARYLALVYEAGENPPPAAPAP